MLKSDKILIKSSLDERSKNICEDDLPKDNEDELLETFEEFKKFISKKMYKKYKNMLLAKKYISVTRKYQKNRLKNSSLVMQDFNHQLFSGEVFKELSLGVKDFDEEKAKIILKDLGLDEFTKRHPMSLSGGQKQRLAIASVMCKDSPFVYFDEPTSGMDYSNMIKISAVSGLPLFFCLI